MNALFILEFYFILTTIKLGKTQHNPDDGLKKSTLKNPLLNSLSFRKCTVDVKLLNCGVTKNGITRFPLCEDFVILSDVRVGNNCEKADVKRVSMNWEIWLEGNLTKSVKILELYGENVYIYEQGSLNYGIHKIILNVLVEFTDSVLMEKAFCYFEIIPMPIQTVILGGSQRSIYYKNNLLFEVLTLSAPNGYEVKEDMKSDSRLKTDFEWQCDHEEDSFCSSFQTKETFRTIPGPFVPMKNYNFSLKAQTNNTYFGYDKIIRQPLKYQLVKFANKPGPELTICCLMNCGDGSAYKSNPQEIIHLEVNLQPEFVSKLDKMNYSWKYISSGSEKSVDEIKQKGTPENKLIVMKNKLEENKKYSFVFGGAQEYAVIDIRTCSLPTNVTCTIFPVSGERAKTFFTINCTLPKNEADFNPVTFEFYDIFSPGSILESGRLLGISNNGVLERFVLTREKLYVRTVNIFGAFVETEVNIDLLNTTVRAPPPTVQSILQNYITRIGLISAYAEIIHLNPSLNISTFLIANLGEEKDIKEVSGALLLKNVLSEIFLNNTSCGKDCTAKNLDIKSSVTVAKIMFRITLIIKNSITQPFKYSRYLTTTRVLEIANSILNSSCEILFKKNNFDFTIDDIYNMFRTFTRYIFATLDNIMTMFAFKLIPSMQTVNISSNKVTVIVSNEISSSIITNFLKVVIVHEIPSTNLRNSLGYYIQLVKFNKNPFWWSSPHEINTQVLSVKLKNGTEGAEKSKNVLYNFSNINLMVTSDFQPLVISDSVKQPNPKDSPDKNDYLVVVYRIHAAVDSVVFIRFVDIDQNTTLRALILEGERPDFDYMKSRSQNITNDSKNLNHSMTGSTNNFLYLGVLPGASINVSQTLNYSFELFSASCKVRKYLSWMTGEKCTVAVNSNEKQVFCSCHSLEQLLIGGYIHVPQSVKNPFNDVPLFIQDSYHPLSTAFLIIVVLIYAAFFCWSLKKDKENKNKVNIIVLDDNDARNPCGYLVGVFTGSKIRAGTTSNVGIRLFGEDAISKSHILKSNQRPTLQSDSDDWFLLFTPHHLGSLKKIKIWMDHSGSRPNWFCSKIFVCDLQNFETDTFIFEKWFGVTIQDINLKMKKECATYKETNEVGRLILENIKYGIKELHSWIGIFYRHPRSTVKISQRLTISICSLLVMTAVSSFCFSMSTPKLEDFASYSFPKEILIIGIFTSLIGSLFSFINFYFFKSSYISTQIPDNMHKHLVGKCTFHLDRSTSAILIEKPNWLKRFYKSVEWLKPCRVVPVQTRELNVVGIKVHKRKLVFSWIMCFVQMILCVHITIYCGIHFPEMKTSLWLTSLLIAIFLTVFIIIPSKIVILALILGITKNRYFPVETHVVGVDEVMKKLKSRNSEEHIFDIFLMRTSKAYHALKDSEIVDMKHVQTRFKIIWLSFYVAECVIFITIIFWLIVTLGLERSFRIRKTVCEDIESREQCMTFDNFKVTQLGEFLANLEKKILPVLFSKEWYNKANLTSAREVYENIGWLKDGMFRIIGSPQLRQIRVKYDDRHCSVPEMMYPITLRCFTPLTKGTEDFTSHSVGWQNDSSVWRDVDFEISPWVYTKDLETDVETSAPSGYICPGGGYVVYLQRSLQEAKEIVRSLVESNWIDSLTRVLILEFTTYNANEDTFTSTTLISEVIPAGVIFTEYRIISENLSPPTISEIIFILFFPIFFIRVIIMINVVGFVAFFSNMWNIHDLITLVTYFIAVVHYGNIVLQKNNHREMIEKYGTDKFFQVELVTWECVLFKNYISVVFCLMAFRFLRIIRFNSNIRLYIHNLYVSISEMCWMWVVIALFIFSQWRLIMFLIESPPGYRFRDVLIFQSDFNIVIYEYQNILGKICAFLLSLSSQFGNFSFTCTLTHNYRKRQAELRVAKNKENLRRSQSSQSSELPSEMLELSQELSLP